MPPKVMILTRYELKIAPHDHVTGAMRIGKILHVSQMVLAAAGAGELNERQV